MITFLKFFLFANGLLILSYFLFSLTVWALNSARIFLAHQHLVRWAQAMVIASALSPALFSLLPGASLPEFRMPHFRSASEGPELTAPVKIFPSRAKGEARSVNGAKIAHTVYQMQATAWGGPAQLFFGIWIAGFLLFGRRLLRRFSRLRQLISETTLIRAMGRIRIGISPTLQVPISAFSGGKYWIVLPSQLLSLRRDWKIALKHELQHHRQGDTLWAVLIELLGCLFYFNPAVYFWKRRIVELQEFSCDEALVGQQRVSSHEYGSCLVRVAETALGCREVYAGTAYMAAAAENPKYFKSFLLRRIEMLLSKNRRRSSKWMSLCVGTLGIAATVSAAYGIERSARALSEAMPNAGRVVVDEKIQRIAQKILADAIEAEEASGGFAIVSDPQSGKVLAVANIDREKKRDDFWALSALMEPASIAKTLVVAEAIEQGKTTPSEKHFCENGKYKYEGRVFHDWKKVGFDKLTTAQTVAMSSDLCTMKIAEKIGKDGIVSLLEKYGFGPEGSAKEFPASRVGQLPPSSGPGSKFLLPLVAYGQGFRSTALELVQAYGAFANGGNLLEPLPADAPDSSKKVVRRVLQPENAEKVKGILREVVTSGTGKKNAGSYLYTTAGKTASFFSPDDEWLETSRGTRKSNMAGFIGFAPVGNPRVEVLVSIRDPKVSLDRDSGAHGSEHAAPVFKQIAEAVLQHLKVAPDNLQQM